MQRDKFIWGIFVNGVLKKRRESDQWQRERSTFILKRGKGRNEELDLVINSDLQQNYET